MITPTTIIATATAAAVLLLSSSLPVISAAAEQRYQHPSSSSSSRMKHRSTTSSREFMTQQAPIVQDGSIYDNAECNANINININTYEQCSSIPNSAGYQGLCMPPTVDTSSIIADATAVTAVNGGDLADYQWPGFTTATEAFWGVNAYTATISPVSTYAGSLLLISRASALDNAFIDSGSPVALPTAVFAFAGSQTTPTGDTTGINGNTGHFNLGSGNTGSYNIGNYNTGSFNIGNSNTGNTNQGNSNTGNNNVGNSNTDNNIVGDTDVPNGHTRPPTNTTVTTPAFLIDVVLFAVRGCDSAYVSRVCAQASNNSFPVAAQNYTAYLNPKATAVSAAQQQLKNYNFDWLLHLKCYTSTFNESRIVGVAGQYANSSSTAAALQSSGVSSWAGVNSVSGFPVAPAPNI